MMARLLAAAETGPGWAEMISSNLTKAASAAICAAMARNGGFVQPADSVEPFPPPPTPPTPAPPTPPTPVPPVPAKCEKGLKAACPGPFDTSDACLTCTREHAGSCKPKDRHHFCGIQ